MVWQLAEPEYKVKRISEWQVAGRASPASRLRRDNRPAISGLHPTARERHGREQQSAIALKLIFGYLNCWPGNIVVKYSTEGDGDSLLSTKEGGGAIVEKIREILSRNAYRIDKLFSWEK